MDGSAGGTTLAVTTGGGAVLQHYMLAACTAQAEDMLRRKRHRWIRDALIAIGVAVLAVGIYKLLGSLGVVLLGGP
jgi:hypothetical protein